MNGRKIFIQLRLLSHSMFIAPRIECQGHFLMIVSCIWSVHIIGPSCGSLNCLKTSNLPNVVVVNRLVHSVQRHNLTKTDPAGALSCSAWPLTLFFGSQDHNKVTQDIGGIKITMRSTSMRESEIMMGNMRAIFYSKKFAPKNSRQFFSGFFQVFFMKNPAQQGVQ